MPVLNLVAVLQESMNVHVLRRKVKAYTIMLYFKPEVTVEHRTFSNHMISNAHAIGWILCLLDTMAIIFLTDWANHTLPVIITQGI